MATTTIIPGNFYVTTGTVSGNTITHDATKAVEIHSAKIDYDVANAVSNLPIPISKGNRGTTTPFERVIDLKRINKVVTVQGKLADDTAESGNTKRNNLITMLEDDGGVTIVWGPSGNYRTIFGDTANDKAFFTKIGFTETSGTYGEAVVGDPQPFRKIDVQVQFIMGKDL